MAVFKQELNWSSYQDRQLKVLESIDKSLSHSLQIGQHLASNMNKVEYAITSIAHASEASAKNIAAITKDLVGHAEVFTGRMDRASDAINDFNLNIRNSTADLSGFQQNVRTAGDTFVTVVESLGSRIWDKLGRLDGIGREVDKFSAASNQMIKLSGMSGDTVKDFRSELMSVVGDLNRTTGGLFSPQQSYEKIISISQDITSNLDAVSEMSRPLLLTYETLDVNVNTVADLFNRFYTRYTFSSSNMEETLNEIRGNTAGNSANAAATMENIKSLESWINNYAGNDNELRTELLDKVSHYTSWIESMNMDSKSFTDYIKAAAFGDWTDNKELINILNRSGISATQATDMARSGMYEELTQYIMDGVYEIMSQFDRNKDSKIGTDEAYALGRALDNLNINRDLAMEIWNVKNSNGYTSLEEFMENVSHEATMEELAEDKYVSAADKVTNQLLERIYKVVADIQEALGIGVSDIALIAALTKGVLWGRGGSGAVGGIRGFLGSTGNNMVAGSGVLGRLASGGYNLAGGAATSSLSGGSAAALGGLGVAGLGTGALLAVDGGYDLFFNKDSDNVEKLLSGGELAAGGLGAAGIGASMAGISTIAGVATGPVGWAALAAGGLLFLGKKAYDNATELSGNAKEIESQIEDIGTSLQEENKQRLADISELSYQFNQESDLEKQRLLMQESGLFTEEELQGKSEEQLEALIESYRSAASAMDTVTDGVVKLAETYYSEQQNIQQKDFIKSLWRADLTADQRKDIVSLLQTSVSDEKLQNKFSKYLKDDKITKREFNDLLYGGDNALFDKVNLTDTSIDVSGMQQVAGYLGLDTKFITPDNAEEVVRLYNAFKIATNAEERDAAWQAIVDSGLEDEVRAVYSNQFGAYGYADGSNYIDRDQIALIHEGEAVVPKKYNPAANNAELTRAIEYLERSQSEESKDMEQYFVSFVEELQEIRKFLGEWKAYNIKKERLESSRAKYQTSRTILSQYMNL